jgi:hypothetical protein
VKDGALPETPLKVVPERAPAKSEAASKTEPAPKSDPAVTVPVDPTAYEQLSIFARALQLVKQDFVDESKVGYKELMHAALRGVLSSLDPHCQFLDSKEYKSVQEDTRGRFSGVGLVVSHKDGKLVVVTPMEGGPGLRAGILSGDVILKVDDRLTEKFGANEVAGLLRGDTGKAVKLTLYRPQTKQTIELEVVREAIQVATVRDAKSWRRRIRWARRSGMCGSRSLACQPPPNFQRLWMSLRSRECRRWCWICATTREESWSQPSMSRESFYPQNRSWSPLREDLPPRGASTARNPALNRVQRIR